MCEIGSVFPGLTVTVVLFWNLVSYLMFISSLVRCTYLVRLFQNESLRETFHVKMSQWTCLQVWRWLVSHEE